MSSEFAEEERMEIPLSESWATYGKANPDCSFCNVMAMTGEIDVVKKATKAIRVNNWLGYLDSEMGHKPMEFVVCDSCFETEIQPTPQIIPV